MRKQKGRLHRRPLGDINARAVVIALSDVMPICRIEIEVFDALIGRMDRLVANDDCPSPSKE
jgi:hypothetical protein